MVVSPSMSQDMIADILSRLSVKSLIRFKSVSKLWLSLITSPQVFTLHRNRSKKNTSLLFMESQKNCSTRISLLRHAETIIFHSVDLRLCMDDSNAFGNNYCRARDGRLDVVIDNIVGSCGGLLCMKIVCRKKKGHRTAYQSEYVLLNPYARRIKHIKSPQHQQSVRICCEGFGYSSKINDYKLVRIGRFSLQNSGSDSVFLALVFSWRTDSWRLVENWGLDSQYVFRNQVSIKSELYWMVTKNEVSSGDDEFILAFDMTKDIFRRIDFPCLTDQSERRVTSFKDSLAFFYFSENRSYRSHGCCFQEPDRHFDLWVMDANAGSGWTKLFEIQLDSHDYLEPLTWRDKRIIKTYDRSHFPLFLLYDHITEEKIPLPISLFSNTSNCSFYECAESLALVDVDGTN